jgi:hypothetical protein
MDWIGVDVALVQEAHLLLRHVGVHRNVVLCEVAVDDLAATAVVDQLFGQGRANTEGHAAETLRARGLDVENATKSCIRRPRCNDNKKSGQEPVVF